MFKHILIAHDLRDTADMALCRATQLAQQHNARLTMLHVLDPSQSSDQHEKARQALDRSLTQYAPPGTELRIVQEGIPAAIPTEMCYLGWQESLTLLALLVEPEIPG